jgi:hypothetical protein
LGSSPFRSLIDRIPEIRSFVHRDDVANEWLAEASAIAKRRSASDYTRFQFALSNVRSTHPGIARRQVADLKTLLIEFAVEDEAPGTDSSDIIVEAGKPFDYFAALSSVISLARSKVMFVDPYADTNFLSRYVRPMNSSVEVRILADRYFAELEPAVQLLSQQKGQKIELRKKQKMHDRFVIIDGNQCFTSGASFKDGGNKSPTHITEIRDFASTLIAQYENHWSSTGP